MGIYLGSFHFKVNNFVVLLSGMLIFGTLIVKYM